MLFEIVVVLLLMTLLIMLSASFFQSSKNTHAAGGKISSRRRPPTAKGSPVRVYRLRRGEGNASIYIYVTPSYNTMVFDRRRKPIEEQGENNKLVDLRV